MNTSLKLISTAMTVAVLAAPVMTGTASAESWRHARAHATTSTVYGDDASPVRSQSSGHSLVQDCVRVAFPQCSGGN